jgi:hypothetical protein
MYKVTAAIKRATGMKIADFCTHYLRTDHKAFGYRLRNRALKMREIDLIIHATGQGYEDLFFDHATLKVPQPTATPTEPRILPQLGEKTASTNKAASTPTIPPNKKKEVPTEKEKDRQPEEELEEVDFSFLMEGDTETALQVDPI